jgi:hypothetical protein
MHRVSEARNSNLGQDKSDWKISSVTHASEMKSQLKEVTPVTLQLGTEHKFFVFFTFNLKHFSHLVNYVLGT